MRAGLILGLVALSLGGCKVDTAELKPTIGNCLAAFKKSDEPRDVMNAVRMGMLGMVKYGALPENERQAYQASAQAERAEALKLDTSGILGACRAQLEVPERTPMAPARRSPAPAQGEKKDQERVTDHQNWALSARAVEMTK